MKLLFSMNPKTNFVKPAPPPTPYFQPNPTILKRRIEENDTRTITERLRIAESYSRFYNMMELVKSTGQPCGSCGRR